MRRGLHVKLTLIMALLILSVMVVVGSFLINSVMSFYVKDFYSQMADAFGQDQADFLAELRTPAEGETDGAAQLDELLRAYAGALGVDGRNRNYYVLDGVTGEYLAGSAPEPENGIVITPNIEAALLGRTGGDSDVTADYMDAAIPITRGEQTYIIYILDNRQTMRSLNAEIFALIAKALVLGLVISLLLSFLLSRTIVAPIARLNAGLQRVAEGDFSRKIEVTSRDEIGALTESFNAMAQQLRDTIAALEKAESTRREFVANVSHELRTPLTNIHSYAETLVADEDIPPDVRRGFLGIILSESDRMAHIVQDLLTLSRFDSGRSDLNFTRFPFDRAIRDTYQAILLEARRHDHTVTLRLPAGLPEIVADRERIVQVMMNILSNAIKYTPDGGSITVTAGTREGGVWLEVDDNGIGIPPQDRDRIFERFYRVDKARSRQSGGTGLGLSIAREIVTGHHGALTLVDKEGPGLRVRLELPLDARAGGAA